MMRHPVSARTPRQPSRQAQAAGVLVSAWLTDLPFRWDEVSQGARTRQLAKDETLFLEGQPADAVYVIVDGRIRLSSYSPDGNERHLLILGPQGMVGDCGLRASPNYVVSATAAADSVVAIIPMHQMLLALEQRPMLVRQQQELASMRFRVMNQHLALQGSNSGRRRVCHHLLGLMGGYGAPHPHGTVISIAFTQQEMGSICGLSRVSVSHIFTQLEREQVITRAGRLVVVVDSGQLEVLSRT